MTHLLDSNVLIAFVRADHVHHAAARVWLGARSGTYATCPITQGAWIRFALRDGMTAADARSTLESVVSHRQHEFWPDELGYLSVRLAGVVGHRQVTDAYLAALARARGGRLATFDRGLAALHPDVAELIPT